MTLHGGISVIPTEPQPLLGDPSRNIHIIDVHLVGDSLKMTADIPADQPATVDISTAWTIINSTNARVNTIAPQLNRITFQPPSNSPIVDNMQRVEATFQLKR